MSTFPPFPCYQLRKENVLHLLFLPSPQVPCLFKTELLSYSLAVASHEESWVVTEIEGTSRGFCLEEEAAWGEIDGVSF